MKKVLFLMFVVFGFVVRAQQLDGVWQAQREHFFMGWESDAYRFFPDGRFQCFTGCTNEAMSLIAFRGTYEVKGEEICFFVEEIKTYDDYKVRKAENKPGQLWELCDGTVTVKKQQMDEPCCLPFAPAGKEAPNAMRIGNALYYKVANDKDKTFVW